MPHLIACLCLLFAGTLTPSQPSSPVPQDAKEVVALKKQLADVKAKNELDPIELFVVVNKVRSDALAVLEGSPRLSDAWEGARVDCPTCKPGRAVKQTCLACLGAGDVPCAKCVGVPGARLHLTRSVAEARESFGAFFWWSWLTTYAGIERDKHGFAIGSGTLPCPNIGAPGHREGKCKACRGKNVVKCGPCKGKGATKCGECRGRGEVERACSDCGGLGELPDPRVRKPEQIATCSWCAGSAVRACRDCVLSEAKSEREAFQGAAALFTELMSKEPVAGRRALPGHNAAKCPTCAAEGEVDCANCAGTGDVFCHHCKGVGKIDSSTGMIMCPFCGGKAALECEDCAGEGEVECPACLGEKERAVGCRTCSGLVWRPCAGCFRSGGRQWELNAEFLAASGEPAAATLMAEARVARLAKHAELRRLYLEVVGLDWVTGKPLTLEELDADEADLHAKAEAAWAALRKQLGVPDDK